MKSPNLNDVIFEFENSNKPIVAALHGTPLRRRIRTSNGMSITE